MIWGNLYDTSRINVNIGDYLQFIAINHIYKQMDITGGDKIRYIDIADVKNYDGEKMILPINFSLHDFMDHGKINISKNIVPVFLGLMLDTVDTHIDIDKLLTEPENHQFFMKYAPIGCRDRITYEYFMKYNIPAYLNGCLTAALPRLPQNKGNKIIFADAPVSLLPFIPEQILNQECIVSTQQYHFSQNAVHDYKRMYEFVEERYEFYKQNAKLIITSRLHVALPCTAFGIPVILAKDYLDTRFDFAESYIPLYDGTQYDSINWSPNVPDTESVKQRLIAYAVKRLQTAMEDTGINELPEALLLSVNNKNKRYSTPYDTFHKNNKRFKAWAEQFKKNEATTFHYALWGVTETEAVFWKQEAELLYPKAKLEAIFDKYKTGFILGVPLQNPDTIVNLPDNTVIIVCAAGATSEARYLFKRLGFHESRYCIVADCFINETDLQEK